MWKLALKINWYIMCITCVRTGTLKPKWNYVLQIFETMFGSLKDENKILKKDQGKSFKTFYYPDPTFIKKTKEPPNTGPNLVSPLC